MKKYNIGDKVYYCKSKHGWMDKITYKTIDKRNVSIDNIKKGNATILNIGTEKNCSEYNFYLLLINNKTVVANLDELYKDETEYNMTMMMRRNYLLNKSEHSDNNTTELLLQTMLNDVSNYMEENIDNLKNIKIDNIDKLKKIIEKLDKESK